MENDTGAKGLGADRPHRFHHLVHQLVASDRSDIACVDLIVQTGDQGRADHQHLVGHLVAAGERQDQWLRDDRTHASTVPLVTALPAGMILSCIVAHEQTIGVLIRFVTESAVTRLGHRTDDRLAVVVTFDEIVDGLLTRLGILDYELTVL